MRIALSHHSPLPGIRLVHRRDLARDVRPLHLAAQRAAAALALEFLPLEEFVAAKGASVSDLVRMYGLERVKGRALTRTSSAAG